MITLLSDYGPGKKGETLSFSNALNEQLVASGIAAWPETDSDRTDDVQLEKWSLSELVHLANDRGVKSSGTKAQIIERLKKAQNP